VNKAFLKEDRNSTTPNFSSNVCDFIHTRIVNLKK